MIQYVPTDTLQGFSQLTQSTRLEIYQNAKNDNDDDDVLCK